MILTDIHDGIATITIDRQDRRNALDAQHNRDLGHAIRSAESDNAVRAIVLTGSGSAFCSGADLRDFLPDYHRRVMAGEEPEWSFGSITGTAPASVPIIAAINGHAIAGGLELALACDVRICTPDASFAMAEVKWGITPGAGGTVRLPQLVGVGMALDMLLTARTVEAEEALAHGLVSRIVDRDELLEHAFHIARSIASNGPLAVAAVRGLIDAGAHLSTPDRLQRERDAFFHTLRTADAGEGSAAFAEKRTPIYKGE